MLGLAFPPYEADINSSFQFKDPKPMWHYLHFYISFASFLLPMLGLGYLARDWIEDDL